MFFQEKRNIVSIISTILITAVYYLYVYYNYIIEDPEIINNVKFWATVIIVMIPVQIIFKIIIHIIFTIVNKIATNEDEPPFSDELDKLIELKSLRNAFIVFMAGFALSMASQLIDMGISTMFITLLSALLLSEITGDCTQIYYYRRGL